MPSTSYDAVDHIWFADSTFVGHAGLELYTNLVLALLGASTPITPHRAPFFSRISITRTGGLQSLDGLLRGRPLTSEHHRLKPFPPCLTRAFFLPVS